MSSVLAPAPPPSGGPPVSWSSRIYAALSAYLPILLMALLALGTWWLVKNTPHADAGKTAAPLRHDPDYTMHQFTVRRFTPDGRLRVQIEGDTLRHYPDTDTIEIDNVRLHDYAPDNSETIATARRAISNGDVTEVQLLGGAHVVREQPNASPIEFRGEFLQAFLNTEALRSHLPVLITQDGTELQGDSFEYDNLDRLVQLKGRVRAVFPPQGTKRSGQPAVSAKP